MNARIGSGWQTLMADLSMVLFMISAAAVGEPVAVWRGTDPAALRAWLDGQGSDPRQRLTIIAPQPSAQAALTLAAGAGRPARVLIEPQRAGQPYAALTFDQDPALARPLLNQSGNPQEPQP